jgi:hypothetical protein
MIFNYFYRHYKNNIYNIQYLESTLFLLRRVVYFICSDNGNGSKSCQWCFTCYTTVK